MRECGSGDRVWFTSDFRDDFAICNDDVIILWPCHGNVLPYNGHIMAISWPHMAIYTYFYSFTSIFYFRSVNDPINGLVGQLAARWLQVALHGRLPIG